MKEFKPLPPDHEDYLEGYCDSCWKYSGYQCKVLNPAIAENKTDKPCWAFTNDPEWEVKAAKQIEYYRNGKGYLTKEG